MAMTLTPPSFTHQRARTMRRAFINLPALFRAIHSCQCFSTNLPPLFRTLKSHCCLESYPQALFRATALLISCSHPSTPAVAYSLPPTSSVTTSSSQLILHNTLLTTGGSTPLITNSLTQSSPPPLPPPILSFISSHGTSCSTAGATPLMSVTHTSSTAAYTSTISHSSMNYTVQYCYFKTFCNRYGR